MNYQKLIAAIFLSAVGIFQAACLSSSSAKGTEHSTANQTIENKKAEDSLEIKTRNDKAERVSAEKPKPAATPKPKPKADNFVCPEPNLPCHHREKEFANWELSFRLPAKIVPNREYKSAAFYAVILKKYSEVCEDFDAEPERQRIQKLFPSRKVFGEYSCPDMDSVSYDFAGRLSADGETNSYADYIAVYAGADEAEGREIFNLLKKDYPQAELKKMTISYSRIEQ